MKLTLTQYETTYTAETPGDDVGIDEVVRIFRGLLLQAGYAPENVNEYIAEEE